MVVIGIDAHTRSHTAAAVDEHGRELGTLTVGAGADGLEALDAWIAERGPVQLVAIEGARGFGLPITRRLLTAGAEVVDVPTHLTAFGRRSSRSRGKDDESDAVTIARVALREPGLPRLRLSHLTADLKLLVHARDQVVAEGTRVRNRLHALLLALAPGYRDSTGALATEAALRRARRLVRRAEASDPVRARLALAAIRRLRAVEAEAGELEAEIRALVDASDAPRLLAICGVGPIVAAKILGETHDVGRFPTAAAYAAHAGVAPVPASSGTTTRHRLNRGGNRQLNRALFTVAMVQARWWCWTRARRLDIAAPEPGGGHPPGRDGPRRAGRRVAHDGQALPHTGLDDPAHRRHSVDDPGRPAQGGCRRLRSDQAGGRLTPLDGARPAWAVPPDSSGLGPHYPRTINHLF